MTQPLSNPMTKTALLHERDQHLADAEASVKTELARLQAERQAVAAELEAEAQAHAEAAALAAKQGIPVDLARRRIERERGAPAHGGDTMKMTPAEYAEHRRRLGIG